MYFEMSLTTHVRCLTFLSHPCSHEFILFTTVYEIQPLVHLFLTVALTTAMQVSCRASFIINAITIYSVPASQTSKPLTDA